MFVGIHGWDGAFIVAVALEEDFLFWLVILRVCPWLFFTPEFLGCLFTFSFLVQSIGILHTHRHRHRQTDRRINTLLPIYLARYSNDCVRVNSYCCHANATR